MAALFQSTLPRGSDPLLVTQTFIPFISIHAPSRERLDGSVSAAIASNFNPRSLAGATCLLLLFGRQANFNPRSLAGATPLLANGRRPRLISIHAPSRERHICRPQLHATDISIHAPSRERHGWLVAEWGRAISIHAPSRERIAPCAITHSPKIFQSTLPRGSE